MPACSAIWRTPSSASAIWPALERVISHRAKVGPSIVIDGWELIPAEVSTLQLARVSAVWIDIDPSALERRERILVSFYGASHDPDRMLRNFVPRGAWWNDWIREEARTFGMRIFRQDGNRSVESLRDEVLETVS